MIFEVVIDMLLFVRDGVMCCFVIKVYAIEIGQKGNREDVGRCTLQILPERYKCTYDENRDLISKNPLSMRGITSFSSVFVV